MPYKFRCGVYKDRFGATERLLISPDHRVQTATGMVEAKKLGLQQEERRGYLTYYNLELAGGVSGARAAHGGSPRGLREARVSQVR